MLQEQAACAGLLVHAVENVDLAELEAVGYTPTGRRANQPLGKRRKAKGMVLHVMTAARPDEGADAPNSVAPLEWSFDNSFWLGDAEVEPTPAELLSRCRDALAPSASHALAAEPSLVDSYTRPEDGKRARTYQFVYRSSVLPLSRDRTLELNAQVCAALAEKSSLELRVPSQATVERLTDDDDDADEPSRVLEGRVCAEECAEVAHTLEGREAE